MTDSDQAATTAKQPEDRSDLLAKARLFLASPQVQHQDINAKRAFLIEKGLNDTEIAELLRTIVCVYIPSHLHYFTLLLACAIAIHSSENLSPAASLKFAYSPSWSSALVLMVNWWFCGASPSISCPSSSIVNCSYSLSHFFFKKAFIAPSDSTNFIGPSFFESSSSLPSEAAHCFSCNIKGISCRVFVGTSSFQPL